MRRRLLLTVAATSILILLAFLVPLAVLVGSVAESRATSTAVLRVQSLVPVVGEAPPRSVALAVDLVNADDGPSVTVFLPGQEQVGEPAPLSDAVALARTGRTVVVDTEEGREVAVPILGLKDGTAVIRVLIGEEELSAGVLRARLALLALAAVLLLLAVAIGDTLARSFIRPIEAVAQTAGRLASGDLDARVTPAGPPETQSVAVALNRLAARIVDLLHAEREAVADLSHRLRTPVTALRLDVEALPPGEERDRLVNDVGSLTRSIDAVITEARRPIREGVDARCDAASVVRARVEFWSALADDEGRRVDTTLPTDPVLVASTATDLAASVDALLGNVFAHTPSGTAFSVSLTQSRDWVALVVTDEGPGWRLAHPERRGHSSVGSTGLGLDIAARTAQASGGSLERHDGPGEGAVVVMSLGRPDS
ncbi:MAG TPA: HAMP domain-containing sensor histidine kinase [Actinomycetes bacterium]|nr:HAMP domain-containing sensor histidine kinase [Actinomycetes bacterium]